MGDKEILLSGADCVHTTELGKLRIKRNLGLPIETDAVEFCKNIIIDKDSRVYRQGKNLYCEKDGIKITVNSYSYTIITAHKSK